VPGSLRLGKIAGIDIYAHFSWFIILILLTWSLASNWFAQVFPAWTAATSWLVAAISALLLFVCVLAHELAHALAARASGSAVRSITLFIFGGVAQLEEEAKRPGVEFRVALAGPIASFLLAGVAFLLAWPLRGSGVAAEAVLDYLAAANFLLAAFNLLPAFPLDGGRILRSIIWQLTGNFRTSTRVASSVGQACAYLLMLFGIVEFFTGNFFTGLWTAFIGWFLLSAAQSANSQVEQQSMLQGITVGQIMDPHPVTVAPNISLQRLMDEYILPLGLSSAPVMQGEDLVGLITLNDITRVGRERWSSTPIAYVMRLLEQVATVTPEQPLHGVLLLMGTQDMNQVLVVQNGRLVGLLSREAIIRFLQVRQHVEDERQHTV
jgi:Zn-dependent protease/CBS domain-containing protein